MSDFLARLGRWLLTGSTKRDAPQVCEFCADNHHVHDVHTGRCITSGCRCEWSAP